VIVRPVVAAVSDIAEDTVAVADMVAAMVLVVRNVVIAVAVIVVTAAVVMAIIGTVTETVKDIVIASVAVTDNATNIDPHEIQKEYYPFSLILILTELSW
jgi:hypothetical protein